LASFLIQQNTTLNTNPETVARELKIIFQPESSDQPDLTTCFCLLFKHCLPDKTRQNKNSKCKPKIENSQFYVASHKHVNAFYFNNSSA